MLEQENVIDEKSPVQPSTSASTLGCDQHEELSQPQLQKQRPSKHASESVFPWVELLNQQMSCDICLKNPHADKKSMFVTGSDNFHLKSLRESIARVRDMLKPYKMKKLFLLCQAQSPPPRKHFIRVKFLVHSNIYILHIILGYSFLNLDANFEIVVSTTDTGLKSNLEH